MSTSPTCYLTKDGDDYSYHTDSTFKNTVIKFKPGVEFENETLDGRKVMTTITFDGNKMIQIEKGDKKSEIIRDFTADGFEAKCIYDTVESTRWYKAI